MNTQVVAKVLGYRKSERYAIERTLQSAWNGLVIEKPGLRLAIVEVRDLPEILKYTPVLAFASLVINEKLVCIGRCPKKEEVVTWLRAAIVEMSPSQEEGNLSQD